MEWNNNSGEQEDYKVKRLQSKNGYAQKYREIRGVSPEEEKVGYGLKDLQKRKVLSLEWKTEGVMDDESGELMELVEEVPLKELTDAKVERLVRD